MCQIENRPLEKMCFSGRKWLLAGHLCINSPAADWFSVHHPMNINQSGYSYWHSKQLRDLGRKIDHELQPIFTSKKIADDLRETELKPPIVNQQSVVYEYKCGLCNTNYIGYTSHHLHQRVEEHKHSVIGKHLKDEHSVKPSNLCDNFTIPKKCWSLSA